MVQVERPSYVKKVRLRQGQLRYCAGRQRTACMRIALARPFSRHSAVSQLCSTQGLPR